MLRAIPQFIDTTTICIGAGGVVLLILALLLRLVPGTRRVVPTWLSAGLVGVLVGVGAALTAMHAAGYHWRLPSAEEVGGEAYVAGMEGAPMGPTGMGMGMGMGGMGGFAGGSRAARELTTLVWKLDMLTKGLSIELSKEQAAKLAEQLAALDKDEQITGKQLARDLLPVFDNLKRALDTVTDEQKAVLDSIARPRRRRGSGAAPQMPGYPGMSEAAAQMEATPVPNPFREEQEAQRLQELLKRLQGD